MPVRYSTASRSVFDGIVPVLVQTPPSIRSCSISATDLPSLAAAMAAFCPPGPEPMTTRSYSLMDGCIPQVLLRVAEGVWRQNLLDEAAKIPLVLVADVYVEPVMTPVDQVDRKGNPLICC